MTFPAFTPKNPTPRPDGARLLHLDAHNQVDVVTHLEHGLEPATIRHLADWLDLPIKQTLDTLGIPSSTYHHRSQKHQPLSPADSERVYRLARVIEAAETYFDDDQDAARRWLTRPKHTLNGRTPIDYARTSAGAQYVQDLLGRLAHGVIS